MTGPGWSGKGPATLDGAVKPGMTFGEFAEARVADYYG